MSWFRVDDKMAFHAKVVAAGNEAVGAWVRAGAWSCDQLTDGVIPKANALVIAPARVWRRLVEVRLVVSRPDGFELHGFHDYNPSAAEVRAEREAKSEAKRRAGAAGGRRSGEVRRSKNEADREAEPKQNEAPIPIPIPIPENESARAEPVQPRLRLEGPEPFDLDQPMPPWALPRVETLRMTLGEPRGPVDVAAEWVGFVAHVAKSRAAGRAVALCEPEWASWLKRTWDFARRDVEAAKARPGPRFARGGPQSDETWERDPTGGF
jgi:hypothetical protein